MRKWPVTNIMQQHTGFNRHLLFIRNSMSRYSKLVDCFPHEMHRTQRMLHACVLRTGIHIGGQAKLFNAA
jgi:hypothetical protein